MAESGARALRHLARAAEELALALSAALAALGEHTRARALLCDALRAEERRWRARGALDRAAARVADVFGALADVLEPEPPAGPARGNGNARAKFDPPGARWDTPARWRS